MPYIRGYVSRAETGAQAGSPIRFVASTEGIARDGLIIDADAWELDNYRANPVVLWSHDYAGARPPIGRAVDVFVEGNRLMADIEFDQGDEFARNVERKYREGYLHSVSVGWDTKAVEPVSESGIRGRVTRADLLDISAVPVPGDPNATIARQARALADLLSADPITETTTEATEGTGRTDWEEASAAMADLFLTAGQRSDDAWRDDYRRLARTYERLGRTAPEPVERELVAVLSPERIAGLFLEGEPRMLPERFGERAGKVLSRTNLADLQEAIGLISRVIERAAPADGQDDTDDEPAARGVDDTLARLRAALGGDQ